MRRALALLLMSSACLGQVEHQKVDGALLECFYDGSLVYSGSFDTEGEGISLLDFEGSWRLVREDGVECVVTNRG